MEGLQPAASIAGSQQLNVMAGSQWRRWQLAIGRQFKLIGWQPVASSWLPALADSSWQPAAGLEPAAGSQQPLVVAVVVV